MKQAVGDLSLSAGVLYQLDSAADGVVSARSADWARRLAETALNLSAADAGIIGGAFSLFRLGDIGA